MTPEHQRVLRAAIRPFDVPAIRERYKNGDFPHANAVKDLELRFRWDLFWMAHRTHRDSMAPIFDAGYTDAHIDTALRSIVRPLNDA